MRQRWIVVCVLAGAFVGLAGFAIYRALTRTTLGLVLTEGNASLGTLVDNLSSSDHDLVMTSLDILKGRGDAAGQTKARTLLTNSDDYIWFNAAIYLGAIKDREAVPYLIKGLKHPAYRSYPEVVRELEALTGQVFGMDQAKWIGWWKKSNPGSSFSFVYGELERQSAEIQTGSHVLINRVIDPLTVSYMGSPVAVVGLRLKKGASAATAQRLLESAVLGQSVEIERDGAGVGADGSVPALMSWEPDPINPAGSMELLRRGLPPVPFTVKTSVQRYLLDSGLYELDVGTVGDPVLRAKLEAYGATTKPAGAGGGPGATTR